jgi:hypothetical protein
MHYKIFSRDSNSTAEILKRGRQLLLASIPKRGYPVVHTSYDQAKKISEDWYQHVKALNERVGDSRKRADKMGFDYDITLQDMVEIWINQQGRCALTGTELDYMSGDLWDKNPRRASIDRIDSDLGYVRGNVRLLCHWANNAKSTYSDELFREMCGQTAHGKTPL